MKQFSLEEYLKNPSRKVVTRDGRNVKIHCTNYAGTQPIIAQAEGSDYSVAFADNGKYYIGNFDSKYDLFFAPEKHEGWVNIYRGPITGVPVYKTEEDAKHCANTDVKRIETVKIEWEE